MAVGGRHRRRLRFVGPLARAGVRADRVELASIASGRARRSLLAGDHRERCRAADGWSSGVGAGVTGRVAVCVSGEGTNLRALRRYEKRGLLGGRIELVLAD